MDSTIINRDCLGITITISGLLALLAKTVKRRTDSFITMVAQTSSSRVYRGSHEHDSKTNTSKSVEK